ncbi:glycosyltransferase [Autumnicola psychrophila]|uniref:Glycosyltransferase n=1 Tax=Autumnicola psychrophila TaxID=3075592 RepID=A0ABU3DS84_9FLAO|nr:glycosyltransferase [Zunongwangia sp. F225]MDT0686571.1 glycosyltransferase [Zunongwangia sp. F225]
MKIYFLTEYSKNIGFGHLSRCSSLADAFTEAGYDVTFFIREWENEELKLDHKKEKVEWINIEHLRNLISSEDIIVFDTYRVSKNDLDLIASEYKHIVSIADSNLNYASRGVVALGSIYGKELNLSSGSITFLAGPEYLLFRKIFWDLPKREIKENVQQILISLGGHINKEVLEIAISSLSLCFSKSKVKVLGNSEIETSGNVEFMGFLDPSDLIKEYQQADLVITNGGQTLNEVILLGIPAIGVVVANNQERNVQAWNKLGVLQKNLQANSGDFQGNLEEVLGEIKKFERRIEITTKGNTLIDSRGARRVVEHIGKSWIKN